MSLSKRSSPFIIGMALFAMFFGSGNLIFPLYIGTIAGDSALSATVGFLLAGVLLPFLGVKAMVLYDGCYRSFFQCIGKRPGFLFAGLLLTVWIPLGSAPRCIVLAHSSLAAYTAFAPPLWFFSLLYSLLVFLVVARKMGVIDILGRYITPTFLSCVAIIFIKGLFGAEPPPLELSSPQEPMLFKGLVEGFNTMDLIASFFFSASVIHILTRESNNLPQTVSLVFRSGIVGMVLLASVYSCLIFLSNQYASLLVDVPKEQALAFLSQHLLGPSWSIIAIVAIILACFSTSVALIIAYADFLDEELFKGPEKKREATLLTIGAAFLLSLFGLQGITYVTAPVLQICYPILALMILFNIAKKLLFRGLEAESLAD